MAKKYNKSPKYAKTPKEKAWKAMSEYIRVKNCLETTGLAFVGHCYTCRRRFHINYLEAGHCFGGRRNARIVDVMIIKPQCAYCNRIRNGEPKIFKNRLAQKYGQEWVDKRRARGMRVVTDMQVDWVKLQKGIEQMRNKLFRKHGYKTCSEILQQARG